VRIGYNLSYGTLPSHFSYSLAEIRKACWGRHVWGRGFFVASSGNVTDEIVREYIDKQDILKPDDNFKVSDGA
jgi:REP element-mobilizing transposase RayT